MVDFRKISFTSRRRYERVHDKNHVDFTTNNGSPNKAVVSIPHTLGYIPFYALFLKFAGDSRFYKSYNGPIPLLNNWEIESISATSTAITLSIITFNTGAKSGSVYYRIYEESQS